MGISMKFSFGGAFGRSGKTFADLEKLYASKCAEAAAWLRETPAAEEGHGWMALPEQDLTSVKQAGEWLKGFDSIIHVGIGGSALGNLMLNQAMFGDYFNEGGRRPKFYLADNPDPIKTQDIWDHAKGGSVALVGVSKSGATAETMSQFLWFRDRIVESGGSARDNILVITDPAKGIFRAFAKDTGCRVLDLPPSVGGRYSVLCPAGLADSYALGVDIDALLAGARAMRQYIFASRDMRSNPACAAAALNCFHGSDGRPMSVVMPYASRMAYFAEWYAQLWAESLGKEGKGTTPVRAVGAIDQHSQVQLYTEGPDDKLFTIIQVRDHGAEVSVPSVSGETLAPLSYMNGAEIGRMLGLEAMSTAAALMKSGHPVIWIEMAKLDEMNLGALIFFYEYMTAMTGRIMGINPFDQPGVEQGKKYTYGLMGRAGFDKDAQEASEWFAKIDSDSAKIGE